MESKWKGFWVRLISADALSNYMKFRGFTNRTLAIACGSERHRSTISHLRSGARKTCGPEIARKIEKALQAPPNSLFLAQVATGCDANRQLVKVSA